MSKTALMNNAAKIKQLSAFLVVGGSAFITHLLTVFVLVDYTNMAPLIANVFGFLIAFNVSFWGHHRITFTGHNTNTRRAMRRMLLLASVNFLANEYFYYLLLNIFHLQYLLALFINLTVLAIITFVVAKHWVFQSKKTS